MNVKKGLACRHLSFAVVANVSGLRLTSIVKLSNAVSTVCPRSNTDKLAMDLQLAILQGPSFVTKATFEAEATLSLAKAIPTGAAQHLAVLKVSQEPVVSCYFNSFFNRFKLASSKVVVVWVAKWSPFFSLSIFIFSSPNFRKKNKVEKSRKKIENFVILIVICASSNRIIRFMWPSADYWEWPNRRYWKLGWSQTLRGLRQWLSHWHWALCGVLPKRWFMESPSQLYPSW